MEDLLGDTRTIDCQDLFKRSMICRPFVLYAAGTGLYPRLHRCDNVVGRTHCELELLRAPAPVAGLPSADRVIRIGVKVLDGNFFACLRRMFNAQSESTIKPCILRYREDKRRMQILAADILHAANPRRLHYLRIAPVHVLTIRQEMRRLIAIIVPRRTRLEFRRKAARPMKLQPAYRMRLARGPLRLGNESHQKLAHALALFAGNLPGLPPAQPRIARLKPHLPLLKDGGEICLV